MLQRALCYFHDTFALISSILSKALNTYSLTTSAVVCSFRFSYKQAAMIGANGLCHCIRACVCVFVVREYGYVGVQEMVEDNRS